MNNGHLKFLNYNLMKPEKDWDDNYETTREWVKNHMVFKDFN